MRSEVGKLHIGVLDIQGSVEEHAYCLRRLGVEPIFIKRAEQIGELQGLIIPGGESTVIGKLMKAYGIDTKIRFAARRKKRPLVIWGTCAGAILMAKKIMNDKPENLGLVDIEIERNAYGRQMESFSTEISMPLAAKRPIPAVFIRAPRIKKLAYDVEILARLKNAPVAVRHGNLLATMFHPEMTNDPSVHRYFLSLVKAYAT